RRLQLPEESWPTRTVAGAWRMPILTAVLGLATALGITGLLTHLITVPTVGPTLATMIGRAATVAAGGAEEVPRGPAGAARGAAGIAHPAAGPVARAEGAAHPGGKPVAGPAGGAAPAAGRARAGASRPEAEE